MEFERNLVFNIDFLVERKKRMEFLESIEKLVNDFAIKSEIILEDDD